jgi:hypothetical protein
MRAEEYYTTPEGIYEINQWCSGTDTRPQALQDADEREKQLYRECERLNRLYNFVIHARGEGKDKASARAHKDGNLFAPEHVAYLQWRLLDARIERERLTQEWAAYLAAEQQARRIARLLRVEVAA